MKSKFLYAGIFLFICTVMINAQKFQTNVNPGYLNLNYKINMDTLAPVINIISPAKNIILNLPVFIREKEVELSGTVSDDKELDAFVVNAQKIQPNEYGKFTTKINLNRGPNRISYYASDKKGNKTSGILDLYQDENADLTPPEIQISEPLLGRGIDVIEVPSTETFKVKGKISDASELYGLWINEQKIKPDSLGMFALQFPQKPKSVSIKAIDINGNASTRSFSLGVMDMSSDSLQIGKYNALLIAVEDYSDINIIDLENPVKDAKVLKNTLIKDYTFNEEDVTLLENPNREDIISALSRLEKKLTSNDNLLVFYAGHGYWDPKREQGYWLPADAKKENPSKWISNSDIRDYIKAIDTRHTLLIADACFSGGIFKTRNAFTEAPASIKETYKYISRKAMTSGTLTEVPDKSEFVRYLVKRLEENNTSFVSAQSLFWSFRDAVTNSGKPTPFYGVVQGAGDEGLGDFIFVRKSKKQ